MSLRGAAKIARRRALLREVDAAKDAYRAAGSVGPLRLTLAQYGAIHPDFKAPSGSPRAVLMLLIGGTCLVPVEIVKGGAL